MLLNFTHCFVCFRSRDGGFIKLEVDREAVFESAMKEIGHFDGRILSESQLDITFKNEAGLLFFSLLTYYRFVLLIQCLVGFLLAVVRLFSVA